MSGVTAMVPEVMWWALLIGMPISLIRRPGWFTAYAAAVIVVAPFSAILTDMVLRRSLIILPLACILAGIAASEVLYLFWRRSRVIGGVVLVGLVLLLGRIAWTNYDDFFNKTVPSPSVSHTFAVELRETMEWIRTLPDGYHLIFFSVRWVSENEVGELLVPEIRLISENRLEKWAGSGTYEIDPRKGMPVFVLIGADNQARLPAIQALYPGGEVIVGPVLPTKSEPAYVAYFVPKARLAGSGYGGIGRVGLSIRV
jgi:hypothetical protein